MRQTFSSCPCFLSFVWLNRGEDERRRELPTTGSSLLYIWYYQPSQVGLLRFAGGESSVELSSGVRSC